MAMEGEPSVVANTSMHAKLKALFTQVLSHDDDASHDSHDSDSDKTDNDVDNAHDDKDEDQVDNEEEDDDNQVDESMRRRASFVVYKWIKEVALQVENTPAFVAYCVNHRINAGLAYLEDHKLKAKVVVGPILAAAIAVKSRTVSVEWHMVDDYEYDKELDMIEATTYPFGCGVKVHITATERDGWPMTYEFREHSFVCTLTVNDDEVAVLVVHATEECDKVPCSHYGGWEQITTYGPKDNTWQKLGTKSWW